MRTIFVALVLSVALPAQAQEHPLRLPTLVFAGAAAADWTTTYQNLSPRGRETNPLLGMFNNQPVPTVIAGASLDLAAAWAWNRFVGRSHPKLAAAGLYLAAGVRVLLATRNAIRLNQFAPSATVICPPGVFCHSQ